MLPLLLLASRRKMRREAETEAEAEADGDGPARRQIRPDCGSRKRGIEAVADAMASVLSADRLGKHRFNQLACTRA